MPSMNYSYTTPLVWRSEAMPLECLHSNGRTRWHRGRVNVCPRNRCGLHTANELGWRSRLAKIFKLARSRTSYARASRAIWHLRRRFFYPGLECLESRVLLTAVPPGLYGGTFASDIEFLDTSAAYELDALAVASTATLTVGPNVSEDSAESDADRGWYGQLRCGRYRHAGR